MSRLLGMKDRGNKGETDHAASLRTLKSDFLEVTPLPRSSHLGDVSAQEQLHLPSAPGANILEGAVTGGLPRGTPGPQWPSLCTHPLALKMLLFFHFSDEETDSWGGLRELPKAIRQ